MTRFATLAAVAALLVGGSAAAEPFQGFYVGADAGYETYNQAPDDGGRYGVFAGYDHRIGENWVIGAEAFLGDSTTEQTETRTTATQIATTEVEIQSQLGLNARLGRLISDRTLVFGTVGYEQLDVNAILTTRAPVCAPPNGCVTTRSDFSFKDDLWTVGVGVEHAFTDNWRARAAYTYGDGDGYERNRFNVGIAYKF